MMRAKMKIANVEQMALTSERLTMRAVGPNKAYPEDGSDENNTYAKWTPQADLTMQINNPALLGKFKIGDEFYVDFTKVE